MFTGIVEEMGSVRSLANPQTEGKGYVLEVACSRELLVDVRLGDSIAINGTCLTVTSFGETHFQVGVSPETLRCTNLGTLQTGDYVNLERAMSGHGRFGGHFVQGHVDTAVKILAITLEKDSLWFRLELVPSLARYIVPKGYVALDGTSLTVCEVNDEQAYFTVMLVAYTQQHVILPRKKLGDSVNLEVDMIGKYVERCVRFPPQPQPPMSSAIGKK